MTTLTELVSQLRIAEQRHEITRAEAISQLTAAFKVTEAAAEDLLENGVQRYRGLTNEPKRSVR